MSHPHHWLHKQSAHWVRDGLISDEQALRLRERHPTPNAGERSRTILTVLGALLLGLGAILLIAYNWADMHHHVKLALVLLTLAAVHGTALKAGGQNRTALAEGLHALGSMLFGAGIWLIAQMYHIDDHYPDAFLLWGLGALTLAWALPSVIQALLAAALIITWQATELFDFQAASHGAPWLLLIGLLPLVGRLNSPLLGSIAAGALLGSLALNAARIENEAAMAAVLFFGFALSALGRLLSQFESLSNSRAYQGMSGPGFTLVIACLFAFSFPEAARELAQLAIAEPWRSPWLIGALLLSFSLWGALLWRHRKQGNGDALEAAMLLGQALLLGLLVTPFHDQINALSILFNLLFLAVAVSMILIGARSHRKSLLGSGIALVLLLAVLRYLDLFDSLLMRALAFLVAGALLFAGGLVYRRRKGKEASR